MDALGRAGTSTSDAEGGVLDPQWRCTDHVAATRTIPSQTAHVCSICSRDDPTRASSRLTVYLKFAHAIGSACESPSGCDVVAPRI